MRIDQQPFGARNQDDVLSAAVNRRPPGAKTFERRLQIVEPVISVDVPIFNRQSGDSGIDRQCNALSHTGRIFSEAGFVIVADDDRGNGFAGDERDLGGMRFQHQ